jgi:hypothetical protein
VWVTASLTAVSYSGGAVCKLMCAGSPSVHRDCWMSKRKWVSLKRTRYNGRYEMSQNLMARSYSRRAERKRVLSLVTVSGKEINYTKKRWNARKVCFEQEMNQVDFCLVLQECDDLSCGYLCKISVCMFSKLLDSVHCQKLRLQVQVVAVSNLDAVECWPKWDSSWFYSPSPQGGMVHHITQR